jgi:hypothetical protein
MFSTMDKDANDNPTAQTNTDKHETIGGMLASALNMEDEISGGVYEDYLDRKRWPEQLDDEVFAEISKRLTVLIEDTVKHKKIIQALVREHGREE